MKGCFLLTFSPEVVAEPVIHNLGMQFGLATNIRRADLSEEGGWIVIEIEGDEDDVNEGISWATSRGVRIEPADGIA